jgi:hypothetical protein
MSFRNENTDGGIKTNFIIISYNKYTLLTFEPIIN